jgi:hypothetical protein
LLALFLRLLALQLRVLAVMPHYRLALVQVARLRVAI